MFDIKMVEVKAGHVGQVVREGKIIWESEPFPSEMVPSEDKLRRFHEQDIGAQKAFQATQDKITEAVERLFA